jgi:alpha-ribazole phosphatase/probable phosphoglycerate mutase
MNGLVFIRHAETDLAGRFCGHSDPGINARGREQTDAMISRLQTASFDAVYSSDLRRATETAAVLADALALPVTTTERLREIDFGDWEGLTWTEIERKDPTHARRWVQGFPALSAPRGEPVERFEQRVLAELEHLLVLAEGERIAVVTHAGVMRVVLRAQGCCSEEETWAATASYCSSFEWPMGARVCASSEAVR